MVCKSLEIITQPTQEKNPWLLDDQRGSLHLREWKTMKKCLIVHEFNNSHGEVT